MEAKKFMKKDKEIVKSLLETAGITINGSKDYDIQIHNEAVYSRVLRQGALGLGESYMDGWWDCLKLDQFFYKVLSANLEQQIQGDWNMLFKVATNYIFNGAKLDLVCKKIGLRKGQRILDIGSGWGSFIGFAAKQYGADALGVTVSKEQKKLADALYKNLPVTTRLQDYRDINEKFDHVVSLGMFEHVGYKNYRTFMKVAHNALNDDGLFLLHTIGSNNSITGVDPWMGKYIFPSGMIPSIKQIGKSIEGLFVMEDWHNLSTDYDQTLMAWHENFEANWNHLQATYDERFHRMWRYYLLLSAASFRARKNQLWQIVLSKNGVPGGYKSIR